MNKLNSFVNKRKKNYLYLKNKLQNLSNHFQLPEAQASADPSWFGFPLLILNKKNI